METRVCIECKQEFPATLEYFYKGGNRRFQSRCKKCHVAFNERLRAKRDKEQDNAKARARRAKDRPKWAAYQREWAKKHKEYYEQWNRENAAKRRQYKRKTYIAHAQQNRDYARNWRNNHPERVIIHKKRRAARIRAAGDCLSTQQIREIYEAQQGKCLYCGKDVCAKFHLDHIVPISRGGTNAAENIAVACPDCNLRKGAQLPSEWLGGDWLP